MKEHKLINPYDPAVHCIQSRLGTSLEKIEEYTAMMQADVQFDPCAGFVDPNGDIWIYDGKHRRESAMQAGSMLLCELEPGTRQDAEWHAAHANTRHGLPRTRNDIINAVKIALRHPYGHQKSDRDLALWCGCDHKTIGKYRKELEASGEIPQMQTRTITRGEQAYQMEIPVKTEPEPTEQEQPVKPMATEANIQQAVLDYCKTLDPFPEEGLLACYRIAHKLASHEDEIKRIRQILELTFELDYSGYPRWRIYDQIGEQAAKIQVALEGMWGITLQFVSMDDKSPRCAICQKNILSGIVFYHKILDEYHCVMCSRPGYMYDQKSETEPKPLIEPEELKVKDLVEEAIDEEHAFQARLKRCRECLDKCYLVKIDEVFGVTHIYEVNHHLAKVRGVTYPYDPYIPFKGMACGTLNFELEDLLKELTQECWEYSKSHIRREDSNDIEPELQPEPDHQSQTQTGAWCSFCLDDLPPEKLYSGVNPCTKICRTCASKAKIELLHPDDSEVIAECQQMEENEIMSGRFEPRRTGDLDKILRTGVLRIFRVDEYAKALKQYTLANSTIAEGIERITWGSWKIVERFDTKKALKARVLELIKELDCIFDGKSF